MKGTKQLQLDKESMLEVVNSYITSRMPMLGVATDIRYRSVAPQGFIIDLAERQGGPSPEPDPYRLPDPPDRSEPTLRVMRQEGVK